MDHSSFGCDQTCANKKKPGSEDTISLASKHVKANYSKKTLWASVRDEDGRRKRRYVKPTSWDAPAIADAEEGVDDSGNEAERHGDISDSEATPAQGTPAQGSDEPNE